MNYDWLEDRVRRYCQLCLSTCCAHMHRIVTGREARGADRVYQGVNYHVQAARATPAPLAHFMMTDDGHLEWSFADTNASRAEVMDDVHALEKGWQNRIIREEYGGMYDECKAWMERVVTSAELFTHSINVPAATKEEENDVTNTRLTGEARERLIRLANQPVTTSEGGPEFRPRGRLTRFYDEPMAVLSTTDGEVLVPARSVRELSEDEMRDFHLVEREARAARRERDAVTAVNGLSELLADAVSDTVFGRVNMPRDVQDAIIRLSQEADAPRDSDFEVVDVSGIEQRTGHGVEEDDR